MYVNIVITSSKTEQVFYIHYTHIFKKCKGFCEKNEKMFEILFFRISGGDFFGAPSFCLQYTVIVVPKTGQ